jgi:hypothetical protein
MKIRRGLVEVLQPTWAGRCPDRSGLRTGNTPRWGMKGASASIGVVSTKSVCGKLGQLRHHAAPSLVVVGTKGAPAGEQGPLLRSVNECLVPPFEPQRVRPFDVSPRHVDPLAVDPL